MNRRLVSRCLLAALVLVMGLMQARAWGCADCLVDRQGSLERYIDFFASLGDRSTGSRGNRLAAEFIGKTLAAAEPAEIDTLEFDLPVRQHKGSTLEVDGNRFELTPLLYNAITPESLGPEGLTGPLIYVGRGNLADFNGREVRGAVVLMDFESGRNWLHAASLGAAAVIYVDHGNGLRSRFLEKEELSPIQLPCFWMEADRAAPLIRLASAGQPPRARLHSSIQWQRTPSNNIYALFPGSDPGRQDELIVVEAFFDTTAFLPGRAPGADEALSIATLLLLADHLHRHPPARPFLLIATTGHSQSQAGMRETIWAASSRARDLRRIQKVLKRDRKQYQRYIDTLEQYLDPDGTPLDGTLFQQAVSHTLKLEVDRISTELMRLRMLTQGADLERRIHELANRRLQLRRIGWRSEFQDLSREERELLGPLVDRALEQHRAVLAEVGRQQKLLKSARRFRSLFTDFEPRAVISLHLSSHGNGLGAFHRGFLYPLRPIINRTAAYGDLETTLQQAAASFPGSGLRFVSTLRPDRLQPWQDMLPDRPQLGGEVSSLAGLPGITLATTDDLRSLWGTPLDTPERIDWQRAAIQTRMVLHLLAAIDRAGHLQPGPIRNGFATVSGRASLLLHGELFAEHPAPGTMLLAFQGPARYNLMTDLQGRFLLKGVADKKHVMDKVIIEGYRFSPADGRVIWAIDKKKTGKPAYRIKMRRRSMKTDLVLFPCRQVTIFNLLEPRTFRYMTKLHLIDGRREAPPVRYWYSRIDTRSSTIASIFLEPEARLKLTLSDSVLNRKLILTGATPEAPLGKGYAVSRYPALYNTPFLVARDMWALLRPRIDNLEEHAIHDERIQALQRQGLEALQEAEQALAGKTYDTFYDQANRSWALASRVYQQVEKTQKDVLFGVLFYIALFVPFAFCLERLLFGFVSIYRRIIAFLAILLVLILVIARVHPAFELAYSPTVVILAFFIIGLSFLVTMIIMIRFEEEMVLLQRRASLKRPAEISNWKAFTAAFFLGVSNLRRRRLRTALTCLTLIILTFTIMSFTTVKSVRRQNRLRFSAQAPYQGILLKNLAWNDLPADVLTVFSSLAGSRVRIGPRVWFTPEERSRAGHFRCLAGTKTLTIQGLMGLGTDEPAISNLDTILVRGRWFSGDREQAVLVPESLAGRLHIDPDDSRRNHLELWGLSLRVVGVFSEKRLQRLADLDGEILTPTIFPGNSAAEMSEVEQEALESGEDVRDFQGRYHHLDPAQVLILPAEMLLEMGGSLKGVALSLPDQDGPAQALRLSDRFGLTLFSGEPEGVFVYNASDTTSYGGMPNIIIPLLISVLIVLNTMIGSVYERKREISVYTSVGLAPSHVSFLFIAEALAFGVLSVVLGYLLAQVSAGFLAGTRLWSGITVNYSSTAGVAAMVLVMGVVLLSVLYPSRVAANIAIPDVNRSWKMPDPEDGVIRVTLPFLMRYQEVDSICGFLYDYFRGHQDVSHGIFSCGEVEIREDRLEQAGTLPRAARCFHLRAKTWLAPFDFGIMQWVDLRFCPAREGEDFLEICVTMTRQAGEAGLWQRVNVAFLHALRKQLLIWRSLDRDGQQQYAAILAGQETAEGTIGR